MTLVSVWSALLSLALAVQDGVVVPCHDIRTEANGSRTLIYRGDRACRDFDDSVTVSGLWIDEFEGQRFIPDYDTLADARRVREDRRARDIWFATDAQTSWPDLRMERGEFGGVYRVHMTGRFARKKEGPTLGGGFGHMGMSDGLFLADRIISVEYLGPLAP